MSPDAALVVFTSLGFASIFLALVIGITGHEPADLVTGIANMTPSARRQAQFEQLDYMTRIADEAIEARRLGKRAPLQQDRFQLKQFAPDNLWSRAFSGRATPPARPLFFFEIRVIPVGLRRSFGPDTFDNLALPHLVRGLLVVEEQVRATLSRRIQLLR